VRPSIPLLGATGPSCGHDDAACQRRVLRIIYLWDADYPWDVRTEKVCATLTGAGHEVHIVARNRTGRPLREPRPEGTVHRMPPWPWMGSRMDGLLSFPAFFSPRWLSLLARTVRRAAAEAIVVRDLPLCPTAIWMGRRARIPVILDMAENYPAMVQELWDAGRHRVTDALVRNPAVVRWIEGRCLRYVDHILVVIDESRERLFRLGVPAERITIVSNTPPRARAEAIGARSGRASRPEPAAGLEMVYLGLLEAHRGISTLLQAMAVASDAGVPLSLSLIGEGRERPTFEAEVRTLGLGPRVRFHGYVPYAEALEMVGRADIGAIPHFVDESWSTTIPNKLFDYMAAGVAVLASDAPPVRRILRETGCGEVFRDRDAHDVVRALSRLRDPDHRARCGAAGRSAVAVQYNWETDAERLLHAVTSTGKLLR
jgi:glycosyltransferase involved in cell wall biosynthesis